MQEKCTFMSKNIPKLLHLSEKSSNFAAELESSNFYDHE